MTTQIIENICLPKRTNFGEEKSANCNFPRKLVPFGYFCCFLFSFQVPELRLRHTGLHREVYLYFPLDPYPSPPLPLPVVFLFLSFFIILTQRKITDRTRQDDRHKSNTLPLSFFAPGGRWGRSI